MSIEFLNPQFYNDWAGISTNFNVGTEYAVTPNIANSWNYSVMSTPTYSASQSFGCNFWQMPTFFNTSNFNNLLTFNTPSFWNSTGIWSPSTLGTSNSSSSISASRSSSSGVCNYKYAKLSRSAALTEAAKNPNLEKLSGGNGWSVSSNSFANDIPYARKGTSAILAKVAAQIGQNITVTSALGTKTSPHVKSTGYASHYNDTNPKLDLGGGLSNSRALALKDKLLATGYFSRVSVESDGATSHLDVQIKESAYNNLA
jgi:hypothetical protein